MIGNDVVDLRDPEAACGASHARFDRRVFSDAECEPLAGHYTETERRWILWSVKEAAFKAARRERADTAFSPKRFAVRLDRSLRGAVTLETRRWLARVRCEGGCVHAVAGAEPDLARAFWGMRRLAPHELADASEVARRFAIAAIAARLGLAPQQLRVETSQRMPRLLVAREDAPLALSLSHHGSCVAFACSDPRFDRAQSGAQP